VVPILFPANAEADSIIIQLLFKVMRNTKQRASRWALSGHLEVVVGIGSPSKSELD
jgi:hypothetical protein